MLRTILMIGTIAIATPALSQQAATSTDAVAVQADATTPAAAPAATQAAPTTAPRADASTKASTADATDAQTANAASGNVEAVVSSEFATYDADKSGELSKDEFAKWMIALRDKSGSKETADATTWANTAFAQADKDKSKTVSQSELTTFLQG